MKGDKKQARLAVLFRDGVGEWIRFCQTAERIGLEYGRINVQVEGADANAVIEVAKRHPSVKNAGVLTPPCDKLYIPRRAEDLYGDGRIHLAAAYLMEATKALNLEWGGYPRAELRYGSLPKDLKWIPARYVVICNSDLKERADPRTSYPDSLMVELISRIRGMTGEFAAVVGLGSFSLNVREAAPELPIVNSLSPGEVVDLLHRAWAAITVDTDIAAIADAAAIPGAVLVGPTKPRFTGPWNRKLRIVRSTKDCAPCSADAFRECKGGCMRDIPVTAIMSAFCHGLLVRL